MNKAGETKGKYHLPFFPKLDLFLVILVVLDILITWYALSKGTYQCNQSLCTHYESNPFMADMISDYGFAGAAAFKLILIGAIVVAFESFDLFITKGINVIKSIDQIRKIGEFMGKISPVVSFAVRTPALAMASIIVIQNVITVFGGI